MWKVQWAENGEFGDHILVREFHSPESAILFRDRIGWGSVTNTELAQRVVEETIARYYAQHPKPPEPITFGRWCPERHPEGGWFCRRDAPHEGAHKTWGRRRPTVTWESPATTPNSNKQ